MKRKIEWNEENLAMFGLTHDEKIYSAKRKMIGKVKSQLRKKPLRVNPEILKERGTLVPE